MKPKLSFRQCHPVLYGALLGLAPHPYLYKEPLNKFVSNVCRGISDLGSYTKRATGTHYKNNINMNPEITYNDKHKNTSNKIIIITKSLFLFI